MKKLTIIILLISCNKSIKELVTKNKIGDQFWEFIKEDKDKELKEFLNKEENKDLDLNNQKNENDEKPLTLAARCNSRKIINLLLSEELVKRIDINIKNGNGQTALIVSISDSPNCLERNLIIRKLLNKRANTNVKDHEDRNALMLAINKEDVVTIKEILDKDVNINAQNIFGETALILAIKSNINQERRRELIELILNKESINLNKRDKNGKTALCYALIRDNFSEILTKILRKKVNFIYSLKNQDLEYENLKKFLNILNSELTSNYNVKCLLKENSYEDFFNTIKKLEYEKCNELLNFIFYKIIKEKDIIYKNKLLEIGKKDINRKTIFDYLKECRFKGLPLEKAAYILMYKYRLEPLSYNVFLSNEDKVLEHINTIEDATYEGYCQLLSKIIHQNTEEIALDLVDELARNNFNFVLNNYKFDTFLHSAVKNGCLVLTKKFLEICPDLCYIKGKNTNLIPLFEVFNSNCPKDKKLYILEEFLKLKNFNIEDYSFFFDAVICKEIKIVERLLSIEDINFSYKNHHNQNCLSALLFNELLIKEEENVEGFDFFQKLIKNYKLTLPKKRKIFLLAEFLINKVNKEEKDAFGRTTLDYVLLTENLLEHLKNKNILDNNIKKEKIKFLDTKKVVEAIENNDINLIDPTEIDNTTLSGHNLFHYIAYFGSDKNFIRDALSKFNTKNLNSLDYFWQTPLTILTTNILTINNNISKSLKEELYIDPYGNAKVIRNLSENKEIIDKLYLLNKKLHIALLLLEKGGKIHVHEKIIKGDMIPSLPTLMYVYALLKQLNSIEIVRENIKLLNKLLKNLIYEEDTLLFLKTADHYTVLDLAILYDNKTIIDCIIENKDKKFYSTLKDHYKLSYSQRQNIEANLENRGYVDNDREKKGVEFTFFEAAKKGYSNVMIRILEEVPKDIKDNTLEEILSINKQGNLGKEIKLKIEKIIELEIEKRRLK